MPKQVKLPNGDVLNFPDDMDEKTMHQEVSKFLFNQGKPAGVSMMGPSNQYKGLGDEAIDLLRPFVASAAATAGSAVPIVGAPAAYTGADYLMQLLKQAKTSPEEKLANTAMQWGLGKIFNLGGRVVGAVRNANQPEILNFAPTSGQALKAEGLPGAGITNFIENTFAPGARSEAAVRSGQAAQKEGYDLAGKIAGRAPEEVRNSQQMVSDIQSKLIPDYARSTSGKTTQLPFATDPKSLDALIADKPRLEKAIVNSQLRGLGNIKQDLAGYRFARIVEDATDNTGRFDAQKARALFNSNDMMESNKMLYNSASRSNIEQFFKNAEAVQGKSQGTMGMINRLAIHGSLTYFPMRFLYSAAMGNFAGAAAAAGAVGMEISAATLGKLLTKPETARLMVRFAGAEPLGMSDQLAGKLILRGLNGSAVSLIDAKGNKQPAMIRDGSLVPLEK